MKKNLNVVALFLFLGCSHTSQPSLQSQIRALQFEVQYLRGRVDELSGLLQQQLIKDTTNAPALSIPFDTVKSCLTRRQEKESMPAERMSLPLNTTAPNSTNRQLNKAEAERCQAITRNGAQCTRKAQKASRYCWQHQK